MMFDARQEDATSTIGRKLSVPVLYYTQLLGLSMKFGEDELGLQLNKSPTEKILEKLS
jgi:heterodisulfide reductase subunit B